MKILKHLLLVLLFSSCGSAVHYDYEKSTDFNTYKSYNYFDGMKTGLNELDTKRLMRSMDTKLKAMGLTRSDDPDFFIDIKSQDRRSRNNSNVGIGVGGGGGHVGGGMSIGIPVSQNKHTREISIEFVDDSKTGMFWQAISESNYNLNSTPEKRETQFESLVEKIFAKYPPKKK